jgi:hypothetical protein
VKDIKTISIGFMILSTYCQAEVKENGTLPKNLFEARTTLTLKAFISKNTTCKYYP